MSNGSGDSESRENGEHAKREENFGEKLRKRAKNGAGMDDHWNSKIKETLENGETSMKAHGFGRGIGLGKYKVKKPGGKWETPQLKDLIKTHIRRVPGKGGIPNLNSADSRTQ